jgi:hypothetical protein
MSLSPMPPGMIGGDQVVVPLLLLSAAIDVHGEDLVSAEQRLSLAHSAVGRLGNIGHEEAQVLLADATEEVKRMLGAFGTNQPGILAVSVATTVCLMEASRTDSAVGLALAVQVLLKKIADVPGEIGDAIRKGMSVANDCNQFQKGPSFN